MSCCDVVNSLSAWMVPSAKGRLLFQACHLASSLCCRQTENVLKGQMMEEVSRDTETA